MVRNALRTGLALAVLSTMAVAVTQPAAAKAHKKMEKKVKLVPAMLKPTYRGMPGYVGGAPGPRMPGLVDIPLVPAGGGLLKAGILPSSGIFKGVPVLGDIGL